MKILLGLLVITFTVISDHSCEEITTTTTTTTTPISTTTTTESPAPHSLVKEYDKINEHLVKKVHSDRVEANMIEASRWFKSPHMWVSSGHLRKALKQFTSMLDFVMNERICDQKGIDMLERNDAGLNSDLRLQQDNYQLKRIDRLIEYYHFQYVLSCSNWAKPSWSFNSIFGFKGIAYERIGKFIEQQQPADQSVTGTMTAIKAQLGEWEKEDTEGALTEAARQIVSLESTLDQNKCSAKSFEILSKNELAATRQQRLGELVDYYAQEHANLCKGSYETKFRASIKSLRSGSLRSVVILATEFYLHVTSLKLWWKDNLAELIEKIDYEHLGGEFVTPEIGAFMDKVVQSDEYKPIEKLDLHAKITQQFLLQVLKQTVPKAHPDYGYLMRTFSMHCKYTYNRKLKELTIDYLLNPCSKFKNLVDNEILRPYGYDTRRLRYSSDDTRDLNGQAPDFLLGKSASLLCEIILNNADLYIQELVVALVFDYEPK